MQLHARAPAPPPTLTTRRLVLLPRGGRGGARGGSSTAAHSRFMHLASATTVGGQGGAGAGDPCSDLSFCFVSPFSLLLAMKQEARQDEALLAGCEGSVAAAACLLSPPPLSSL